MSSDPDAQQTDDSFSWPRLAGFVAVGALLCLALPWTAPDKSVADDLTTQFTVRAEKPAFADKLEELGATEDSPIVAKLQVDGSERARESVLAELRRIDRLTIDESSPATLRIETERVEGQPLLKVRAALDRPGGPKETLMEAERRTGGWTAILPPLVAVLLALFFRRLIVALVSAVVLGALLQTGFNPVAGLQKAAVDYLWGSVADSFSLYIIGFTFCLVGMVHVIIRMGGIAGLLEAFSWLAESARSTRIATALMGLALFFDDYANTIVVGTTMRPMTDKQKISREKLAYLVDSTSAPIAGIAVISTWIGYEVGLFDELSRQLQMGISGYGIFFEILPLRFYCILTLVFVFMVAVMGRDYGPMLSAERRALHDDEVLRPDSDPLTSSAQKEVEPKEGVPLRWINAVAPVACVLAGALLGMFWSGWSSPQFPGGIPAVDQLLSGGASLSEFRSAWGAALPDLFDWTAWRDALSRAANAKVLFWASIVGSLVSIALAVGQRLLSVGESLQAWSRAIPMMGMAVAILVLAWSIQSVCDDLGTSIYLVGTVQHLISASLLPLLTFGLAAVVAFSTGTSWGTMGILLPAMIPLAFHMTAEMPGGEIILFMCFGAVLDGAIFGDHCSPISDTTVMSSIASSVDHMDHVQTQMPYALTSMTVSAAFGYVGVAFGLPIWAAYLLGTVALFAILATLGKDPTKQPAQG